MPPQVKGSKVELRYVLDFYDAYLRCGDLHKTAIAVGLKSTNTLLNQLERCPDLALAKKLADERRGHRDTFSGYIFQRLSPDARKAWQQIQFWDTSDSAYEKIESILQGKTKQLRQELFVHALTVSNFDLSSACRMTGTPRNTLENWRKEPEFRMLVEEIQWHKKNFFERALLDLVEERHPSATIFVNRTVNADRGYNEKLTVTNVTGDAGLALDELNLPLEVRKQILEAIRRQKLLVQTTQPMEEEIEV